MKNPIISIFMETWEELPSLRETALKTGLWKNVVFSEKYLKIISRVHFPWNTIFWSAHKGTTKLMLKKSS